MRAFRTILERENNIITDPSKLSGKGIPGFLYDAEANLGYNDWLWNVRIEGLGRCFPGAYGNDDIAKIKLDYQKKLLKRLWWNLDES